MPMHHLNDILRSMRGAIVDARIAYPEVLHVEIKDSAGELWRLATQDAEWSPADPSELVGRSVEDADVDEETGELRCKLSDGSLLDVKPAARDADDPPNWELITPGGVVLECGPGVRWQIGSAEARPPGSKLRAMDPLDDALCRAHEIFLGDLSDATDAELDALLPLLIEAGYVKEKGRSETGSFWAFTESGVRRAEELGRL